MIFSLTQSRILTRTRRVIASSARCSALALAILMVLSSIISSWFLSAEPAEAFQEDWRKMSRTARYKVDENDYEGAVDLYTRAIQTIRKTDPTSEYVYDLIINLAETHMVAGNYTQALRVLETIESQIHSKQFCDPMLPVRFLRRKSRVDMAVGNKAKAIDEETEMLNIVGRYFSRTAEHYQGQLRKLIELMWKGQAWRKMAEVTPMLRKTEVSVEMFSALIEQAGIGAMKSGDFDSALKLLSDAGRLYETDERRFLLLGSWNQFADRSFAAHRLDLYPLIEKDVRKLIRLMQLNTVNGLRGRSMAHYCLAVMYQRQGNVQRATFEFNEVRRVFPGFDPATLSAHDYHLLAAANLNVVNVYLKNNEHLDEASVMMQQNLELTPLPRESSKIGEWSDFPWYHCLSRLQYARLCAKRNDIAKAIQTLDSIDMTLAEKHPGLPERITTLRKALLKKTRESDSGTTK